MNALFARIGAFWAAFIDAVGRACEMGLARVVKTRRVDVIERADGRFDVRSDTGDAAGVLSIDANGAVIADNRRAVDLIRGARAELVLRAQRFLFNDCELPSGANQYADGIVRNRLDLLTPWAPDMALYGQTRRVGASGLVVAVAAMDKRQAQPLIDAVTRLGPRALAIFAGASAAHDTPAIKLIEQEYGLIRHDRLRAAIGGVLMALGLGIIAVTAWTSYAASELEASESDIRATIAGRLGQARGEDPSTAMETRLFRRKSEGPLAMLVIEEMSRILPDNTYLSEIEVNDDKVRIAGLSQDAPSLIGIVEHSPMFSGASFAAPTTRDEQGAHERFQIVATIRPRTEATQ